jgi:hypothetical protein
MFPFFIVENKDYNSDNERLFFYEVVIPERADIKFFSSKQKI